MEDLHVEYYHHKTETYERSGMIIWPNNLAYHIPENIRGKIHNVYIKEEKNKKKSFRPKTNKQETSIKKRKEKKEQK